MFNRKSTLYRAVSRVNRNLIINPINRKRLKNENFTIISNNCVGSLICHDLNQKFLTPTVNLIIYSRDFIKFVSNLEYYLKQEIEQIYKEGIDYPVGKLGDIEIYFMHYHDFNEAREKWHERSKRINLENVFIMLSDNNCSEDVVEEFERLPYKNKVFLTQSNYNDYESTFYIKGSENINDLTLYKNPFGQKFYDCFDYVKWLNNSSGS